MIGAKNSVNLKNMNEDFYRQKFATGMYGGGVYDIKSLLPMLDVKPGYNYLEVGVGTGRFMVDLIKSLNHKPTRICASDLENNVQPFVSSLITPVEFSKINLGSAPLPYADGTFDLIICNHVLEHIFETEAAMRELRRVLSKDGTCVVSVPNIANWWSRFTFLLYGEQPLGLDTGTEAVTDGLTPFLRSRFSGFKPSGHVRGFTPRGLRDLSERCGFKFNGWWNQNIGLRNKILQPMMGIILNK